MAQRPNISKLLKNLLRVGAILPKVKGFISKTFDKVSVCLSMSGESAQSKSCSEQTDRSGWQDGEMGEDRMEYGEGDGVGGWNQEGWGEEMGEFMARLHLFNI